MKIIDRPIKRIFTFGCSFTYYGWAVWPEYLSLDLNIPHWNYGRSGGGNQFIANMITQADNLHRFDENDLIMVSWTNVCREDRWINQEWIIPGNIFSQNIYDANFVKKYADPVGYLIRDLATISLTMGFLKSKNCQFHCFSMCNIIEKMDQGEAHRVPRENNHYQNIIKQYSETISNIKPSFYDVLWQDDIHHNKFEIENKLFNNKFCDGHPNPIEHFRYLEKVFSGHRFKDSTRIAAEDAQTKWVKFISNIAMQSKKTFAIYNLDHKMQIKLKDATTVKKHEPLSDQIV